MIVVTAGSIEIPPITCEADECRAESNCNASHVHDDPNEHTFHSVCLNAGTEPSHTGRYDASAYYDREGVYRCSCCGHELFAGEQKFNSGTGWPSFWAPYDSGAIGYSRDLAAVELHCAACKAHLGHVFTWPVGPGNPTGLRYCIDGVCLRKLARGADERRGDVDLVAVVRSLLQQRAGGVGRRAVAQRPLELARRVRRGVPAVWRREGAGQGYDEVGDADHLRPMPELYEADAWGLSHRCCAKLYPLEPCPGTRADAMVWWTALLESRTATRSKTCGRTSIIWRHWLKRALLRAR